MYGRGLLVNEVQRIITLYASEWALSVHHDLYIYITKIAQHNNQPNSMRSNPLISRIFASENSFSTDWKVLNWARKSNWLALFRWLVEVAIKHFSCERASICVNVLLRAVWFGRFRWVRPTSGTIKIFFSSFHNNLKKLKQKQTKNWIKNDRNQQFNVHTTIISLA